MKKTSEKTPVRQKLAAPVTKAELFDALCKAQKRVVVLTGKLKRAEEARGAYARMMQEQREEYAKFRDLAAEQKAAYDGEIGRLKAGVIDHEEKWLDMQRGSAETSLATDEANLTGILSAAVALANVECNNTKVSEGCGEKWCVARERIRSALDAGGIPWSPKPVKAEVEGNLPIYDVVIAPGQTGVPKEIIEAVQSIPTLREEEEKDRAECRDFQNPRTAAEKEQHAHEKGDYPFADDEDEDDEDDDDESDMTDEQDAALRDPDEGSR